MECLVQQKDGDGSLPGVCLQSVNNTIRGWEHNCKLYCCWQTDSIGGNMCQIGEVINVRIRVQ